MLRSIFLIYLFKRSIFATHWVFPSINFAIDWFWQLIWQLILAIDFGNWFCYWLIFGIDWSIHLWGLLSMAFCYILISNQLSFGTTEPLNKQRQRATRIRFAHAGHIGVVRDPFTVLYYVMVWLKRAYMKQQLPSTLLRSWERLPNAKNIAQYITLLPHYCKMQIMLCCPHGFHFLELYFFHFTLSSFHFVGTSCLHSEQRIYASSVWC